MPSFRQLAGGLPYQAGIAALLQVGIRPPNALGHWSHTFVPGQLVGQLVNRRKIYPVSVRETLPLLYQLRQAADYSDDLVTQTQALRALRRAREFVLVVIREQTGETR